MIIRLLDIAVVAAACVTLASSDTLSVHGNGTGDCSACNLKNKQKSLDKLKPLCGKKYTVLDSEYTYEVGICTNAGVTSDVNSVVGVLQIKMNSKDKWSLGNINETDFMSGENWMYLEYDGGANYAHACNQQHRRSIFMITCKKGEYGGTLTLLEEDANKTSECHYLFQLSHDAACTPERQLQDSGLSNGGIICVVLFSVTAAYLIFGTLYMRCFRGAKGWRQIPNYEFWKDFGNLQADGCDLICRCGRGYKDPSVNHYHGIGDHQIESAGDSDRDEHLLPM